MGFSFFWFVLLFWTGLCVFGFWIGLCVFGVFGLVWCSDLYLRPIELTFVKKSCALLYYTLSTARN